MSMIMNHDLTAMLGHRIMQKNSLAMKRSLEKLSSGLRTKIADIDNTAGLAISETMMSRIGGKEKALNNSQDGISLIQTATGALEQTQSMLQRMRELSVQAANDTLTQQDRSYIQVEINEIRDEITNLAANTQFNRKHILSGDNAVLWSSTNEKVKAIVNGGIRSIDNYGQKYAVDGNYKLSVSAEAGKAQVQKGDVFRIKHDDSIAEKSINEQAGVRDVSAEGVPSGSYNITLADSADMGTAGVLTGSFGIGGSLTSTSTEITFQDNISSPVTKVTVSTTDGTEIWSTTGSDIFGNAAGGTTTAADQSAFFEGRTGSFAGVKDEIIAAAREKGITLSGFGNVDDESGGFTLTAQSMNEQAPGIKITYETAASGSTPAAQITGTTSTGIAAADVFSVSVDSANMDNASILFEVTHINEIDHSVTLKATASKLSQDGVSTTAVQDNIILDMGANGSTPSTFNLDKLFGGDSDNPTVSISLGSNGVTPIQKGAKFVYSVKAGGAESGNSNPVQFNIESVADSSDPDKFEGGAFNGQQAQYILNGEKTAGTELRFTNFFVNSKNGQTGQGTITLTTDGTFKTSSALDTSDPNVASFKAGYVGKVADGSTKLRDIDKFWTSEGNFILDQPKELTLTQGDGKQARVMIYGGDTVDDLTRKLNDAVATGLGQAKYTDDAGSFVTFVDGASRGFESVEGTLVIRSVLAGKKGEITLSGNEDILKAFSLNTIQDSEETKYTVTVRDAHDDSLIAQNVKITGNTLHGVIHKNIDVEFDPMLGIAVSWDDSTKNFALTETTQSGGVDVVLHLADNTAIFQTGDSEGDDVMLAIGDMRATALGLDGVNVMSQERASYSTSIIDAAIDKVSMQMAKLGAAQNRLEHHIGNLTDETEALVGALSRIRDVDYMTEIMNFAKQNILMNSNTAMLAQANQIQSSTILSLLR